MIVNGQVFESPEKIDIRFEVDPAGETIGPLKVMTSGGLLWLKPPENGASLTFSAENNGCLMIGDKGYKSMLGDDRAHVWNQGFNVAGCDPVIEPEVDPDEPLIAAGR
jgi:hypothetical protein